jgi:predicted acylesterase/phospholipase RssA
MIRTFPENPERKLKRRNTVRLELLFRVGYIVIISLIGLFVFFLKVRGLVSSGTAYAQDLTANSHVTTLAELERLWADTLRVEQIEFQGNKAIQSGEIISALAIKPGQIVNQDALLPAVLKDEVVRIRSFYQDNGYFDVEVSPNAAVSEEERQAWLTYSIVEGDRYNIGEIGFSMNTVFEGAELQSRIGLQSGDEFSNSRIRKGTNDLINFYGSSGYAFAEVSPLMLPRPKLKKVDITFKINEGNLIRIRQIHILGNTFTFDEVIRRYVSLSEQEVIDMEAVRQSFTDLMALGLFETVEIELERLPLDSDMVDVNVTVKEKARQIPLGCPGTQRLLVLGGGGIRGAYQIGALWYLVNQRGCTFSHFVGTSTGAISAALMSQASDLSELKTQVDLLVKDYMEMRSSEDLVKPIFLGEYRIFLPRWLGGVDGLNTLEPLITKLSDRKRLDVTKLSEEKLTIPVVSLQAGNLTVKNYTFYSALDRIVGSASIPIVVEPRLARLWVPGYIYKADGDDIVAESDTFPGIPDSDCLVRLEKLPPFPCRHIKTTEMTTGLQPHRWRTSLRIREREHLEMLRNRRENDRDRGLVGTRLEFTALHQLVDGGVVDNVPLDLARKIWEGFRWSKEGRIFDTVFLLTTGYAVGEKGDLEVHGGKSILLRSLDSLWADYQQKSLHLDIVGTVASHYLSDSVDWIVAAQGWRRGVENGLNPAALKELDKSAVSKFPTREALIFLYPPKLRGHLTESRIIE